MHFRLGTLTCQANVNDLLAYVNTSMFPVIQENIRTCISLGTSVPSSMVRNKPEHFFSHMLVIMVIICPACVSSLRFPVCCFQAPSSSLLPLSVLRKSLRSHHCCLCWGWTFCSSSASHSSFLPSVPSPLFPSHLHRYGPYLPLTVSYSV